LSIGISAANLHDSQALIPLVRGIPSIRSRRGPRRRRPGKLHGDKGYDYRHLRRWLASRGIRHRLARKGVESSRHLGRHRWVVERTVSWLSGCRRLHRRYERKPEHFLGLFKAGEIHSLENLRGIPKGDINSRIHLSEVFSTKIAPRPR
jgi:transposase